MAALWGAGHVGTVKPSLHGASEELCPFSLIVLHKQRFPAQTGPILLVNEVKKALSSSPVLHGPVGSCLFCFKDSVWLNVVIFQDLVSSLVWRQTSAQLLGLHVGG